MPFPCNTSGIAVACHSGHHAQCKQGCRSTAWRQAHQHRNNAAQHNITFIFKYLRWRASNEALSIHLEQDLTLYSIWMHFEHIRLLEQDFVHYSSSKHSMQVVKPSLHVRDVEELQMHPAVSSASLRMPAHITTRLLDDNTPISIASLSL